MIVMILSNSNVFMSNQVTDAASSQLKADEVLWIGDSWVQIPGIQHTRVRDLARAAGAIGPNEDFVDRAVSSSSIDEIERQYDSQEAGPVKVKLLLMDGGGTDILSGGAAVLVVGAKFNQFLSKVKSDGTVQAIVYYLYARLPVAKASKVESMKPVMSQVCTSSAVPCYFLDCQPIFAGHPEFVGPDGTHPSAAGALRIGNAIWKIIQTKNLLRLAHCRKKVKGKAGKAKTSTARRDQVLGSSKD
jgi:hypothetical protein